MTVTTPVHVDSSVPELWASLVLRDMLRGGFWNKFSGAEGSRSPIIRRTDLLNAPGDTIHVQITAPLAGAGVAGDETALEGSEENLTTSSLKVIPLLRRHGVRTYRRANKKSILDLRSEARLRLAEWGQEKMDDIRFANFGATGVLNGETYTPNFYVVGGGSTGASDVATTDDLTVAAIMGAKLTMYNNRALPLRTADGNDYFGMVCSPNALFALKRETEYMNWVREAEVRGKDNPFFQGATAMIDGVVLFQHNNVVVENDGAGGTNPVARNILFGAEAFIEGLDENPTWVEETFDYENEFGIGYSFAFQPRRALAKNSLIVYSASDTP